jgi:hypothetical protein
MFFESEIPFSFPLIKIRSLITYLKVKKPSGISYFLLVLINEFADREVKISDLLKEFGVPVDLHSIFAAELTKLIKLEIISTNYDYNPDYFEEYKLGFFNFTRAGKKMFIDEQIPMDSNNEVKQEIYFNPGLNNQLALNAPHNYGESFNLDEAKSYFEKLEYTNVEELEDYLNTKKGDGIKIKREEVIIKVEILLNEYNFLEYPCKILINNNFELEFKFLDNKLQKFFDNNFSPELIEIILNKKFKFVDSSIVKSEIETINSPFKIFQPNDLEKLKTAKSSLDLFCSGYETSNNIVSFSYSYVKSGILSKTKFINC